MADGYGSIIANSWRCHISAWVLSQTDTTATIRVEARFQAVNGWYFQINGVQGKVTCNGQSASATGSVNITQNGETVICRKDVTVSKGDNARNITCSATITQSSFNSGSSSASCAVSVAGVAYLKPNAPRNVSYKRESDSAVLCTWQAAWDNAARKPWHGLQVWMRQRVGGGAWGAWSRKATLNWDATSYRFTGLKANACYQFTVYATNPAGESTHVDSAFIYTTPAAPKTVTAAKTSATSVKVSVDASNTFAYMVRIDRVVDGTRTHLKWETPVSGKATYTDSAAPAATVAYDVIVSRPVYGNDTTKGELVSAWKQSNTVATMQPPAAPTILAPMGVLPIGQVATIEWKPSHPDGSAQSAAQVEVTKPIGGGNETIDISGTATSVQCSCPTPGEYTVRVRTKGVDAEWGAWSSVHSWRCANPPMVTLNPINGDNVVRGLPIEVEWSVSDGDGIARQTLTITDGDGPPVFMVQPGTSVRHATIRADQYTPSQGAQLLVSITVLSGSSLQTTATQLVTVDYDPPAVPSAQCDLDAGYGVTVTVHAGTEDGKPATEYLSVYRDVQGSSTLVAPHLAEGEMITDRLPPLHVDYAYRVVAHADSGAIAEANTGMFIDADGPVLNFGPDADECVVVGGAWKVSEKPQLDTSEYHFADDTGLPVSYGSGDLDNTVSVTSSYLWDATLYRRIRGLARTYAQGWLRLLGGPVMYVRVSMSQSLSADGQMVDFDADCDELVWQDPHMWWLDEDDAPDGTDEEGADGSDAS
ncbi:fibronectin type III domain-containing protein [Bifidobacterium cuniculi]|uniref:Fibronectin type III domain-containing protein n=2 Tax=Bifidobacterium cuniculi TaxID=1688 RepID=A0A087B413_9BIFI|nr:fibronectin type III domain-containing protein [Bifidobacterium cuniculi]